jgi:proline-specific peptidase
MQSGTFTSAGVKLYFEVEGEGYPMICLNGGPGFSHEYLQDLTALSRDRQLIFYDQRGTGNSEKADPSTYTVEANVEDVEALRRELKVERWDVFGHSWGGMLAQAYAVSYSRRVSRMILADTFSSIDDCNETLARMRAAVPREVRAVYEKWEAAGLYKGRDSYPEEYQAALDIAYEPVQISIPTPPYLAEMFAKVAYDVYRVMWGEETEFRVTGTLRTFDVTQELPKLLMPVLVIVGSSDMPTIEMAARTAGLLPHAYIEVFEKSRHFPFIEEPEKFLRVVRKFFEQTE